MESPEYRKLYAIEVLVTDAAELVARLMEDQGVTKAELARRLGKSRAWITQLLSGKANMTIRTFAELVYELDAKVDLDVRPHARSKKRERGTRSPTVVYNTPEIEIHRREQPRFQFPAGEQAPEFDTHGETLGRLEYAA